MRRPVWLAFPMVLAASLARASGGASIDVYSSAGISFPTLAVPVGVRAIAMGDAYTAAGDDVYALNWNPAGLSGMNGFQLGLADNEWAPALGMRQEFLTYGQSLSPGSGLGVSLNYFSLGTLDQRDGSTGALLGQSAASAISGNVGYGFSILAQDKLKLGLELEYGMESFLGSSLSNFGGGLGLLYGLSRDVSFGVSVNHLGTGTGGFAPPQSVNAGLAARLFDKKVTLALDGSVPFASEAMINAGLEYSLADILALRAGYRYAMNALPGDVQGGLSAGAGFKVGVFSIDYAFVPYGALGNTHRVAATIQLPEDFFKPRVIGAEATTTTSKAFYNKALAFDKNGENLPALVQYQLCMNSYPEKLQATPQDFLKKARQRVKEIQAEMNAKKGDNEQVRKYRQKFIDKARGFMDEGHFKEAITELQQAQLVDASTTPATVDSMLKEARRKLSDRLSGLRNAAKVADAAGRLDEAVENFQKILAVDSSDSEAEAFFTSKHLQIANMLKARHRKGIDAYVAGRVDEAVKIWIKGRSLDHFGDVDFSRDIDKAKKLLDLRGQK